MCLHQRVHVCHGKGLHAAAASTEVAGSIPAPAWLGSCLQPSNKHYRGKGKGGGEPGRSPGGLGPVRGSTRTASGRILHSPAVRREGGRREEPAHLSPATSAPLARVIYGVIWAASNLIKGHCKLVNRFK